MNLVLAAVGNERQADRTTGMDWSQKFFSKPQTLQKLDGDDETWLTIFQAHFDCMRYEKTAAVKKFDLTARRGAHVSRMTMASRTLRALTENSCPYLGKRTVKSIVTHIVQMLDYQGQLLAPIALDYLRTLRIVLSHPPHRNCLDPELWVDAAVLCFNIVLAEPLSKKLPGLDATGRWKRSSSIRARADSHTERLLGVEEIEEMSCLDELLTADNAPLLGGDQVGLRLLVQYGRFFDVFSGESTAHLPALSGLNRLLRAVEYNHRAAVQAFALHHWKHLSNLWQSKSKAVKEQLVVCFRILLPSLTATAPAPADTQTSSTTESRPGRRSANEEVIDLLLDLQRRIMGDCADRFSLGSLESTAMRFGINVECSEPFQYATFASGRRFSAADAASWAALELGADIIASLIKLQSSDGLKDSVSPLDGEQQSSEQDGVSIPQSRKRAAPVAPAGRVVRPRTNSPSDADRRAGDVFQALLEALPLPAGVSAAKQRPQRVWLVQMLLFLVARHWTQIPCLHQRQIYLSLASLMQDGDTLVQGWALVGIGTVASSLSLEDSEPRAESVSRDQTLTPSWSHTWAICCRRISDGRVSRHAALAAVAILTANVVARHRCFEDLASMIADLDTVSPSVPSDAVCDFFATALAICGTNVALLALECEKRVAAWLQSHYAPCDEIFEDSKGSTKYADVDSSAMVRLLCAICRQPRPAVKLAAPSSTVLADSPVIQQLYHEAELLAIRSYVLDACITEAATSSNRPVKNHCHTEFESLTPSTQLETSDRVRQPSPMEQKMCDFLDAVLQQALESWDRRLSDSDSADDVNLSARAFSNVDQVLRLSDLVSTGLLFNGGLLSERVSAPSRLFDRANDALQRLIVLIVDSDLWTLTERCTLLLSLQRLFIRGRDNNLFRRLQRTSVAPLLQGLIPVGPKSGVRRDRSHNTGEADFEMDDGTSDQKHRKSDELLAGLWQSAASPSKHGIIKGLQQCIRLLLDIQKESSTQATRPQGDGWGHVRQAQSTSADIMQPSDYLASASCSHTCAMAICASGLAELESAHTESRSSRRHTNCRFLAELVIGAPLSTIHHALPALVSLHARGRLTFGNDDLAAILARLGTKYLADNKYKTDENAQLLVLDLLENTMAQWMKLSASTESTHGRPIDFALYFRKNLVKNRLTSWKLRVRVCAFLQHLGARLTMDHGWSVKNGPLVPTELLSAILRCIRDQDVRVRFAVSSIVARFLDSVPSDSAEAVYAELSAIAVDGPRDYEMMLTQLLLSAHIMTRSSPLRSPAFFYLLEPCARDARRKAWLLHAGVLIRTVATQLGFDRTTDLFRVFAAQITFGLVQVQIDPVRLPYEILGYRTLHECLQHSFDAIGPMMLAIALDQPGIMDQFSGLARSFSTTKIEGIRQCLPVVVAIELVIIIQLSPRSTSTEVTIKQYLDELQRRVADSTTAIVTTDVLAKTFTDHLPEMIVATLLQYWERFHDAQSAFIKALSDVDDDVAKTLTALNGGIPMPEANYAHIPQRPVASGMDVYWAISALSFASGKFDRAGTSYFVVHRLMTSIYSERLVNDQIRHLQALKLYIAMHRETFKADRILLRMLLCGSSALMSQVDLLGSVSGVVDWCMQQCLQIPRLPPDTGISIICMNNNIQEQVENAKAPEQAFLWMDDLLVRLLRYPPARLCAFGVLCAYPREIPETMQAELDALCPLTVASLTDALIRDTKTRSNAHLLQRVARAAWKGLQQPLSGRNSSDKVTQSTIWNLIARLPLSQSYQERCATGRALAEVLSVPGVSIDSPAAQQLQSETELPAENLSILVLERLLQNQKEPFGAIRAFVILQVLDATRAIQRQAADETFANLQRLLALMPGYASYTSNWPETTLKELDYVMVVHPGQFPRIAEVSKQPPFLSEAAEYPNWICAMSVYLCGRIADGNMESAFDRLRYLLAEDPALASNLFPALVQALGHDGSSREDTLRLSNERTVLVQQHFLEVLSQDSSDHHCWRAIIRTVLHLRKQNYVDFAPARDIADRWMGSSYLLLARRAVDCGMYATALLFAELLREFGCHPSQEEEECLSRLMYTIYSNVPDPDGFYGITNKDLLGSLRRRLNHEGDWRRVFELEASAFESSGLLVGQTAAQSVARQADMGLALHHLGFNRLASQFASSDAAAGKGPPFAESCSSQTQTRFQYDIAWKMGDWDLPEPVVPQPGTGDNVFSALRALNRDSQFEAVSQAIATATSNELSGLDDITIEGIAHVRRVCSNIVSLKEAGDWHQELCRDHGDLAKAISHRAAWSTPGDSYDSLDFEAFDRLLAVRQSLLRSEVTRAREEEIGDLLRPATLQALQLEGTLLLQTCQGAREHDRLSTATNAFARARALSTVSPQSVSTTLLNAEFARVMWSQGEHGIAIEALQATLDAPDISGTNIDRAVLLGTLGQWRATARSQQPHLIDQQYFRPAFELLPEGNTDEAASVCYQYALFADEQYRAVRDSKEVAQLAVFVKDREEEIRQNALEMEKVEQRSPAYKQLSYHRHQAEKILKQDNALLRQYQATRSNFVQQAFKMYANALSRSDKFNESIIRFTAIWFENADDELFNTRSCGSLTMVPAHKFLSVTHQLSSRLDRCEGKDNPKFRFQENLTAVLGRVCQLHPFHSLYALYAMKQGLSSPTASPKGTTDSIRRRASGTPSSSMSSSTAMQTDPGWSRKVAANELWQRVKASSPHKARIVELEKACDAYVEWAQLDLKTEMPQLFNGNSIRKGPYRLPQSRSPLGLRALRSVNVPVATAELPVDPTSRYREMVTISRYSEAFNTAGGLHLPKIVECIGSDGKRYRQLFKSEDDLRQDAVMQQVFRLLNTLLERDRRTRKRQLHVRTYSVIPLGPQCGLLEFVGDTSPLGELLTQTYEKYRSATELLPMEARSEIAAVMGQAPSEKLAVYRDVCKRMPPILRTLFFDRFPSAASWFAVRLNYTRSVATTSMVGHILGLGDRHVSNILLDNVTGELVHIDFGVAFEQGKLLPIPELVPFRLTRNLVDGMGSSGVEGVFRRCCEETLRVLRSNAALTKTILEVFKYDPLFVWTSNPVKMLRAQRAAEAGHDAQVAPPLPPPQASSSASATPIGVRRTPRRSTSNQSGVAEKRGPVANPAATDATDRDTASLSAERAIQTVMRKLSSTLSVEYAVNELIRSATDEGNLSSIFHGWQAAL
ncbi:unnamed protein product [Parajaminaea phylloscopi]